MDYSAALESAIAAAREAGALLRADFHRPDGPRGGGDHADADSEAERLIGDRLLARFPDFGWLAEEGTHPGRPPGDAAGHRWVVDPNDGTRDYLQGYRGSAVSIALLREGVPVLGVVYAFAPDDGGDLIAWAEGGPLTRNGAAVERRPWATAIGRDTVVLVSRYANGKATANQRCVEPGRFRPMPSIAYRLALAAVGDAEAGTSLSHPGAWDYAAGHALIRGANGRFVDETGQEIRYTRDGASRVGWCFGGAPAVVAELSQRPWREVAEGSRDALSPIETTYPLVRPSPGAIVADTGRLSRAQGCLLGQFAGDALGSLVEFRSRDDIRRGYPDGPRTLADGGTWNTIAGQPTDDSELALMLARSVAARRTCDAEVVARAYAAWYDSSPFDVGGTTARALGAASRAVARGGSAAEAATSTANQDSQANGSLMRISPLGIFGHGLSADELADLARLDSRLTHPHPICQEACAVFTVAVARAIADGPTPADLYRETLAWAESNRAEPRVVEALKQAEREPPADYLHHQGWVLVAFQNAFHQLLHALSLEEGVVRTIQAGGDTDTNAAIAGALLGAVYGRDALPLQWRNAVLTCRPLVGSARVHQPLPRPFWPVDALELTERLLLVGRPR